MQTIWTHRSQWTDGPAPFHHDKVHFLKFAICLGRILAADAPLEVLLDPSHLGGNGRSARCRAAQLGRGVDWMDQDVTIERNGRAIHAVYADPGDMFVLDTNLPHRQGHLEPGHHRRLSFYEAQVRAESDLLALHTPVPASIGA
ncbi:MAG: hypothetical protein V3V08_06820 [Nannocystaceae bacterium]